MESNSIQRYSSSHQHHYDVFVSFRGDIRYSFIDHLFAAFQKKNIDFFRDDTKLQKGKSIAPELFQAIEGSQVLIVVFSKKYASSTWCLRELAKILHCFQVSRKHVLPIFFDVDPSHVRNQSGKYGEAFIKHEDRFKEDNKKMMEVQKWREALTQIANLDIRNKPQNAEIEKIVQKIRNILHNFSIVPNDLVGIESPLEKLEKLVFQGGSGDDSPVVGICGMSGIGKTALARVLYGRIYNQFDVCCFIDDVSKVFRDSGELGLLKLFLCQTLKEENLQIWNFVEGMQLVRTRLRHTRVLIILDNVDKLQQLEKLGFLHGSLAPGSRIIIISRDEHILRVNGANDVYNVQPLNYVMANKLFCMKAFKRDYTMAGYELLTREALEYCGGLPLAINVLGSSLFSRDILE